MQVEEFFFELEGKQKMLASSLHQLLTEQFLLTPKLRYKLPFYYCKSWICYLNPVKNDKLELAFTRGNELSNTSGILESRGRKQVMSCTLVDVDNTPWDLIAETIQEAIALDEAVKYQSKRVK